MRIEWSPEFYDELRCLFVGGVLQEPSPLRLVLPDGPRLAFSGLGVEERNEDCSIDFGTVVAIGESCRTFRVESLGEKPVWVEIVSHEPWLRMRWAGTGDRAVRLRGLGDVADVEIVYQGAIPGEHLMSGSLRLAASLDEGEPTSYDLRVGLRTRMTVPFGRYELQGAAEPSSHDFGAVDPADGGPDGPAPYTVSVEPVGPVPLRVSLEDLPPWLVFELDEGYTRRGPAPGPFFERDAPVRFRLRPIRSFKFLGTQRATIILRTNDIRPEWRRREIDLAARIESERAYVYASPLEPVLLDGSATARIDVPLSNWGRAPARLALADQNADLELDPLPVIPGAVDSFPGRTVLRVTVSGGQIPGEHILGLTLRVDGGSPAVLEIPIRVLQAGSPGGPVPAGPGLAAPGGAQQEIPPGALEVVIAVVLWVAAILLWVAKLP